MTVEVGGGGTLGLAFETVLGTFVTPSKWIPIRSESINLVEDKIWRMNLRANAGRTGTVQGYTHVEGDIEFEVSDDILLYFLYASRVLPAKTGSAPNFTYTFTPVNVAKTSTAAGTSARKTLSLLIARSSNPMAYTGCSVGQLAFTLDNGLLVCTASIVGVAESAQAAGTPAWPTAPPYGPGQITLEVPSGTPRSDADTFTLTLNDNLVTANRLNGLKSAAYSNWGERETTFSFEHDFDTLTDFNTFVNATQQVVKVKALQGANNEIDLVLNAAVSESYAANLSGLGDVVRGSVAYHGFFGTTDEYTITVKSQEVIT